MHLVTCSYPIEYLFYIRNPMLPQSHLPHTIPLPHSQPYPTWVTPQPFPALSLVYHTLHLSDQTIFCVQNAESIMEKDDISLRLLKQKKKQTQLLAFRFFH